MAEDAEVKEGTVLNLVVSKGKVVATPIQKKRLSLKQLLAKVNKKNLQKVTQTLFPSENFKKCHKKESFFAGCSPR